MKAREIVEDIRVRNTGIEEEILYSTIKILEKELMQYGEFKEREFNEDAQLYAPEEFKEMYIERLMREAALRREDWDCYNAHNTLYNAKLKEYRAYIIRNDAAKHKRIGTEQSFKNDWRW